MQTRIMTDVEKTYILKTMKTTKQLGTILTVITGVISAAGIAFFMTGNIAAAAALGGVSLFFLVPGAGSLYRVHQYMIDIKDGSVTVIENAALSKRIVTLKNSRLYNLYYGKTEFSVDKNMYDRIDPDIKVSVVMAARSRELLAVLLPNGESVISK